MSDPRIDNFAKGWVAKGVRYEPVEKLAGRLKLQMALALICLAMFFGSLVVDFQSLFGHKVRLIYLMLALLPLTLGFSAFQMWRFIHLRKTIAAKAK